MLYWPQRIAGVCADGLPTCHRVFVVREVVAFVSKRILKVIRYIVSLLVVLMIVALKAQKAM